MKNTLFFLFLIAPFNLCSQPSNTSDYKTISGFISHKNKPVENVSVFVENSIRFSVSESNGFYSIKAKEGETISFGYIGLEKIFVLIEDVTSTLNIEMKEKSRIRKNYFKEIAKMGGSNLGENTPKELALKIDGKSLNTNAASLIRAIQEKVPYLFVRYNQYGEEIVYIRGKELNGPVLWDIDGVIFDVPFPIYISEVKDILLFINEHKKSVIKINTTLDYKTLKGINFENYYFSDEEYYNNDALPYQKIEQNIPFLKKYEKISNEIEALQLYSENYAKDKNLTNFHLAIFKRSREARFSKKILMKILSDYESAIENNPEDLKTIAYLYEQLADENKALQVYKKLAQLRPSHLQSYRDLANIYIVQKDYRNAWLIYNYAFNQGFTIDDNDIGEIIASEIIATYNLDINTKRSVKKIKVNDPKKNIESDIRIVFEWNSTEAEFLIEFVNPAEEVYHIENSFSNNPNLIVDQKKKGYSSKEVFIENLNSGNYLINLTYFGNKQYKSTVFKITTYFNWGKPNQRKKIEVFDFNLKNIKTNLIKLNRKQLK